MFLPMLAKALGSCERAIVLQQIHWLSRLPNAGVWEQGYHWVWGTYEEWCKDYFPMWSPHTLRKHIQKLEQDGVLVSAQLRAHEHNRTKYYRIHYHHELLSPMRPDAVDSMRPDHGPSKQPEAVASIYRAKTSTKSTAKGLRPTQAQRKRDYNAIPDDDDAERRKQYSRNPYDKQ